MSVTVLRYLYCDAENCPLDREPYLNTPDPDEPISVQRRAARRDGWTRSGGKDYCDECSKKRKPHAR